MYHEVQNSRSHAVGRSLGIGELSHKSLKGIAAVSIVLEDAETRRRWRQQTYPALAGSLISDLYRLLHIGYKKWFGRYRIFGMCFDGFPDAVARRRKKDHGFDIRRNP